jgi:hypothetical protein
VTTPPSDRDTAVASVHPPRRSVVPADFVALGSYLVLAAVVYVRLWTNLDRGYLVDGGQDQQQWEFFFAVTARNVVHLDNPLFTTLLNHPDGVNLMANTVMLGLGVPLTPVTLLFGPTVTWALVLTGGLASTAAAWYWLISRHIVDSRLAAAVGAGFCGFAPAILSHANAHPNFVVLAVIPLILMRLMRLTGSPTRRDGIVLGLLVTWQIFLGEEVLLLATTGLVVFGLSYAAFEPRRALAAARNAVPYVALGAGVSLAIVALPLAWQFFGPQSYHSLLHGDAGNPLAAFVSTGHAMNPTEENALLGWPLIVVAVGAVILMWRRVLVRALALTAVAAAVLSLGAPGPWTLFARLPLYESVIESRMAMVCIPPIGILLSMLVARLPVAGLVATAAAFVPIAPGPLAVADRPEVPAFFTDGTWRQHVRPGRTVVPAPPPNPGDATSMNWQLAADLGFALPEGYFVGPWGPARQGAYGAVPRPTSAMLHDIRDGEAPPLLDQSQVRADLEYWRADAVVLAPQPRSEELRAALDTLLGPGREIGGVWVWDTRGSS